jgi:hypothetical protein
MKELLFRKIPPDTWYLPLRDYGLFLNQLSLAFVCFLLSLTNVSELMRDIFFKEPLLFDV